MSLSTCEPQQRDGKDSDSNHSFITVIPIDFPRNRGFPQPPDQYSDYSPGDGDYVSDGSKLDQGVDEVGGITREINSKYKQVISHDYEDTPHNPQWDRTNNSQADSPGQSLNVCVYLMGDIALCMELEDGTNTTVEDLVKAIVAEEQLGLPPSAFKMFTLWMCSGLLELQLKPHHRALAIRAKWPDLLARYAHATESRQRRDEPVLSFQRNIFIPQSCDEQIKDTRVLDLLYAEARYNILEGRYPCEVAHFIVLGGIQARLELGPYNPQIHTINFFRDQSSRFLPIHMRRGAWTSWLHLSGKNSPEVRLLEHYKRIPASTPDRKLQKKYLEIVWALPYYGCVFFQGQVEQPVRGLLSLIIHQDVPVLVGINLKGVYIIDNVQCTLLLGLKYEELCWDFAKPSHEENPDCLPCLFLQFRVLENGTRVSKVLQIFSKQAVMMDALIARFVEETKKKTSLAQRTDEVDKPLTYDTGTDSDGNGVQIPLATLTQRDMSQSCLGNKLSKLTLATFDEEGRCIGQMGSWSFSY
uniref:FERM domain-containing protein 8 n=1 Tax=Clastoptera arizonana TaxID=38151 RepID=A0A1B6CXC5_9HEMI